jgi:hypothetical protein
MFFKVFQEYLSYFIICHRFIPFIVGGIVYIFPHSFNYIFSYRNQQVFYGII